jgi:hypothetical protein
LHTIKIVGRFLTAMPAYKLAQQAVYAEPGEEIHLRYVANVDAAQAFAPHPPITRFERVDTAAGRGDIEKVRESK